MYKIKWHYSFIRWKKDPLFESFWFFKFINKFIIQGKREKISKLIYFSLKALKKKIRGYLYYFFFEIFELVKPLYILKKIIPKSSGIKLRKKNQQFYFIPMPINFFDQYKYVIHWCFEMISFIFKSNFRSFRWLIVYLFFNFVYLKKLEIFKKKKNHIFHLANENRSNIHFRWK
jgi:hypothetical protein